LENKQQQQLNASTNKLITFSFVFFTHPPVSALCLMKVPVPGKVFWPSVWSPFIFFPFMDWMKAPGVPGHLAFVLSPPSYWQLSLMTRTSLGGVMTAAATCMCF
jgi:hypothetical protein